MEILPESKQHSFTLKKKVGEIRPELQNQG